ncbi:hypothetical protein CSOJ01_01720 [Colletotrichum sojae]|uniref:Uncharacterized protein n=1 Tax=Colletotrichum sojae TaxID=2175907 RepID=A0A8H6JTE7_9PEZI|nr:hypothetical protein CSOJ01_01720 [Colletotrichum sojae]
MWHAVQTVHLITQAGLWLASVAALIFRPFTEFDPSKVAIAWACGAFTMFTNAINAMIFFPIHASHRLQPEETLEKTLKFRRYALMISTLFTLFIAGVDLAFASALVCGEELPTADVVASHVAALAVAVAVAVVAVDVRKIRQDLVEMRSAESADLEQLASVDPYADEEWRGHEGLGAIEAE